VKAVQEELTAAGETVFTVGKLVKRSDDAGCVLLNLSSWD
jgi:hypothetical protein